MVFLRRQFATSGKAGPGCAKPCILTPPSLLWQHGFARRGDRVSKLTPFVVWMHSSMTLTAPMNLSGPQISARNDTAQRRTLKTLTAASTAAGTKKRPIYPLQRKQQRRDSPTVGLHPRTGPNLHSRCRPPPAPTTRFTTTGATGLSEADESKLSRQCGPRTPLCTSKGPSSRFRLSNDSSQAGCWHRGSEGRAARHLAGAASRAASATGARSSLYFRV